MAHSRAVSVLYLLEPVGWLIIQCECPLPARASGMAHSRAVSVLYLLEPVGWLIIQCECPLPAGASAMAHYTVWVSSTCWSK